MSSIRKDQKRPLPEADDISGDSEMPIAGGADSGAAIDKTNVMKSFYQRALEERDEEIERLRQDNQRLRAKIIAGEGADDRGDDDVSPEPGGSDPIGLRGDVASQKRSADLSAQIVAVLNADKEKLTAELADLKDRQLRTLAELENVRRRAERERSDVSKFAISEFARDVIGIGDNIQRAIDHVPAEAAASDTTLKSFLEGVQLLERELLSTLERHGVTRLNPDGERFDPNKHQAVMEQENLDVPAGTIVQVLQAGYAISERTLRPAVVVVSRGGAKIPKGQDKPEESQPPAARASSSHLEPEAPVEATGTGDPVEI